MSKSYSKAPDECGERVAHLLKLFHPDLVKAGVTVDLISIANDDGEPCLTHQGYPAAAVVRIVDSKGRTMGRGDAEIVIDEAYYIGLTDAEKDALLDHELYHIELKMRTNKETGEEMLALDENGRPKLKLRKHDVQAGWFSEIAKRHGAASLERKQALSIYLAGQQTYFAFDAGEQVKMIEAHGATVTREPSDKVKAVAKEILEASPGVQAAARNLVGIMRKHGATLTTATET